MGGPAFQERDRGRIRCYKISVQIRADLRCKSRDTDLWWEVHRVRDDKEHPELRDVHGGLHLLCPQQPLPQPLGAAKARDEAALASAAAPAQQQTLQRLRQGADGPIQQVSDESEGKLHLLGNSINFKQGHFIKFLFQSMNLLDEMRFNFIRYFNKIIVSIVCFACACIATRKGSRGFINLQVIWQVLRHRNPDNLLKGYLDTSKSTKHKKTPDQQRFMVVFDLMGVITD